MTPEERELSDLLIEEINKLNKQGGITLTITFSTALELINLIQLAFHSPGIPNDEIRIIIDLAEKLAQKFPENSITTEFIKSGWELDCTVKPSCILQPDKRLIAYWDTKKTKVSIPP